MTVPEGVAALDGVHRPVVGLAGDRRYAAGLLVAVSSLLGHLPTGRAIDLVIFDEGLRRRDRRRLIRVVGRARVTATMRFVAGFSSTGIRVHVDDRITAASYARLLLPEAAPAAARGVYLDADTLVRAPLDHLIDLDLDGAPLAACPDPGMPPLLGRRPCAPDVRRAQMVPYLNAGILVMDLDQWRTRGLAEQVLAELARMGASATFHDQDGINAVCAGEAKVLDPKWNYQQRIEAIRAADLRPGLRRLRSAEAAQQTLDEASIIHFSDAKPWQFPGFMFLNAVSRRAHRMWWRTALTDPRLPADVRLSFLMRGVALAPYVLGRKLVRLMRRSAPL